MAIYGNLWFKISRFYGAIPMRSYDGSDESWASFQDIWKYRGSGEGSLPWLQRVQVDVSHKTNIPGVWGS